jgi:hypothetical protein
MGKSHLVLPEELRALSLKEASVGTVRLTLPEDDLSVTSNGLSVNIAFISPENDFPESLPDSPEIFTFPEEVSM